jgi:hypothetical protein
VKLAKVLFSVEIVLKRCAFEGAIVGPSGGQRARQLQPTVGVVDRSTQWFLSFLSRSTPRAAISGVSDETERD